MSDQNEGYSLTFEELQDFIRQSGKNYNLELIEKAYSLAAAAHGEQKRRSGEPYIIHPLAVAKILVELGMDNESIAAALLHDVVEDTGVPLSDIEKQFGHEIALLVNGVTKLGRIPYTSKEEQQAENLRKMLLAMAQDIRVVIIKLADRLHNARTFQYLPDEKRRYKALETMEIYAPIADRLGIRRIKEELEDTSLRYLDPIAYEEIESQLTAREERQKFLASIKQRIFDRVKAEHPNAYIEGRVKSIYGIYRKVYMQGRAFDEVYDIYAVRIIVDSVIECYNILGIIHDMFRPIPNRFKDYISTPKQNMYQSLHTTVFDKEGIPFETQIRTWEMHYTAEYGIAALKDENQKERWVKTEWASNIRESFQSSVEIVGNNRAGLLAELSVLLSNLRVPLHAFMAKELKDGRLNFHVTMTISDLQQLAYIISQIKRVPGVISVDRVSG